MGCGQHSEKNQNNICLNIFRVKTSRIEKMRKEVKSKEEKLYIDIYQSFKTEKNIVLKNLILESQIYFSLLNIIKTNDNIERIEFNNVNFIQPINVLTQLFHCIRGKTGIKSIEMKYLSNLGTKKGKSLYAICRELPQLTKLTLDEIELEQEDADYMGILLEKCDKLEIFDIQSIFFLKRTINFLNGINKNNSIKELTLIKLGLTADNFDFLVSSLTSNYCLTLLDVSNNPIGKGAKAIKKYPLVYLTHLIMNNCSVEEEGISGLCEGLEENKTVIHVELQHNRIYDTALTIAAIVSLVEKNNTIQLFNIRGNAIKESDLINHLNNRGRGVISIDQNNNY